MYHQYINRKEQIIISAIEIMDEKGINGLTMKEIAIRQEVTEPAIYRHYKNKQDVIMTILKRFAAFDESLFDTVLQGEMNAVEAIEYFMTSYATYYESYPELITILFSFDAYRYEEETMNMMVAIIEQREAFLCREIEKGTRQGIFNQSHSAKQNARLLMGHVWSTMYYWKMQECKGCLKEEIMKGIHFILEGMKMEKEE
ncbi:TetR/AcrR family transcriptional regulator [Tindallia californiensis]|uniref:DNA-binding transcriptional regulator, AcrR family n=1 Tax=Tindallia californiensis TaxID=159292 RepID=A0A1H3KGQ7_9FIRM|nr:TetR/AcrR family transcriptional regulator [Tindallia californiensis]SDY50808.1 DNA-binding transcriptional regulator, AcrR family [Tindallia californiensis]